MKLKILQKWVNLYLLLITLIIVLSFLNNSGITQTLPKISKNKQQVFYFGYEPTAYPVSLKENNTLTSGTFCYNLWNYLKDQYTFELYSIPFQQRFRKTRENGIVLDVGCGPHSITQERRKNLQSENADFSITYFTTGFKYIVKKDRSHVKHALENQESINATLKIAVINGTTPHDYLIKTQTIYEKNLQIFSDRKSLLEGLKQDDSIVAYLTDELLLKGLLVKDKFLRENYELVPDHPLNKDKMGVVIYNPQLQSVINTWIDEQGRDVMQQLDRDLNNQLYAKQSRFKTSIIRLYAIAVLTAIALFWLFRKNVKKALPPTKSFFPCPQPEAIPTPMEPIETRHKIFISYSHKDKAYLEQLQVYLKPLERKGLVDRWDDTRIKAGMKWREEIQKALDSAKIAVLLVSSNFFASDFINKDELPPLLQAAEADGASILAIILNPCTTIFNLSELSQYQTLNSPNEPLSRMDEHQKGEVFDSLSARIMEIINS